jgi:hypothetical protein
MFETESREGAEEMDEKKREALLTKNQKLTDMVIERAMRDFPDEVALIGLTGSFQTGDYHENSDLDLVIITDTDRPWAMARAFILGEVGYDIYMTPWCPRVEAQARLESPMVSHLLDLKVLYCAKPAFMERFQAYRRQALDELAKPIGPACLKRARKWIDEMKRDYATACVEEEIGAVRYAAGGVLYGAVNALTQLNNTYLRFGVRRHRGIVAEYEHLPNGFLADHDALIAAGTASALRVAALRLLKGVETLWRDMDARFGAQLTPTFENLAGTYEELWCNCRNKVLAAARDDDPAYLFHAALGAQNYLDEMRGEVCGTPKFELMARFDAENPAAFRDAFLSAMDDYAAEYAKVGRAVERYETFEELYQSYMKESL